MCEHGKAVDLGEWCDYCEGPAHMAGPKASARCPFCGCHAAVPIFEDVDGFTVTTFICRWCGMGYT